MTPPTSLSASLADRYAITRELGQGGMAVVYLARDLKHDRDVALKVLRPELAAALGAERFLREIQLTARLNHPHILPLHDSGEAAGFLYYVMPYVEGESLRDRLARERQLPVEDALQITLEVADALGHAHSLGIVHRDIKPENILLAGGHARVADFGIARAVTAVGSASLTETGLAIGTPAYMSPEQAAGTQDLDGRSDLYSLGCVLYEMLAGEPPFTGPSVQAVVAKRMATPAPRVSVLRDRVPAHVEQALDIALARTPADRFATAAQFALALAGTSGARPEARRPRWRTRRVAVVASAALMVAAGLGVMVGTGALQPGRGATGNTDATLRSVAVLPFTSLGDTAQMYIGDGFTNAVIDALVRVEGLRVPASGRVFSYRGRDVREAGRELDVRTVVTGSVQVAGSRLRVWTQLVNVEDGTSVWTHQYSSDLAGIFATQDSIAVSLVEALRVGLAGAVGTTVARGPRTSDPGAYRLYLRAKQAMSQFKVDQGIALFEQALARDSTFADAWVGLADAYAWPSTRLPPAEVTARARRAVDRAIELDSLNGYAFSLRGGLRMQGWDWNGARSDMQRAVRLAPASADAVSSLAFFLVVVGKPDSGLAEARRALALDPANPMFISALASAFIFAGMPDSALAAAGRALALDSAQYFNHNILAQLFAASGRRAEAEREIGQMLRGPGDNPWMPLLAAHAYRVLGLTDRVRAMVRRLEELGRRGYVEPALMAGARLYAGDRAGALDALEEAARNHDGSLVIMLVNWLPGLDGEPRYEAVRREVFGDIPAPRGPPTHRLQSP
jgi:eukaryotic-like serine/threonine-protein kinase